MQVILFGAGASYGSEKARPHCPPLGVGLFDDLQGQYPDAWGALPEAIREKFALNFEPAMKEIWEDAQYDAATLMRCMADYFAQFKPLDGNTYHRLLEHLSARGALV